MNSRMFSVLPSVVHKSTRYFYSIRVEPRANIIRHGIDIYVGRNLRTGLVCKLSLVCRLGETLAQFAYRVSVCKSNDVIAQ